MNTRFTKWGLNTGGILIMQTVFTNDLSFEYTSCSLRFCFKTINTKRYIFSDSLLYNYSDPAHVSPQGSGLRRTLLLLIWYHHRSQEASDLLVTDDEIVKIAQNIEMSLFKYFTDTGTRYKSKFKAIIFNIKDAKNDVCLSIQRAWFQTVRDFANLALCSLRHWTW